MKLFKNLTQIVTNQEKVEELIGFYNLTGEPLVQL